MTRTPGSFSNRRRTVSSLRAHRSATCATEKCCSIEPRDGTSSAGCDIAFIVVFTSVVSRTRAPIATGVGLETCYSYRKCHHFCRHVEIGLNSLCTKGLRRNNPLHTHTLSLSPPRGLGTDDTS